MTVLVVLIRVLYASLPPSNNFNVPSQYSSRRENPTTRLVLPHPCYYRFENSGTYDSANLSARPESVHLLRRQKRPALSIPQKDAAAVLERQQQLAADATTERLVVEEEEIDHDGDDEDDGGILDVAEKEERIPDIAAAAVATTFSATTSTTRETFSYATIVLRELMKSPASNEYQSKLQLE